MYQVIQRSTYTFYIARGLSTASMDRWKGRVALVTGASAGIGAATAELLAKRGMIVAGCARNVDRIKQLASQLGEAPGKLVAYQCDLSKEDDILAMFKKIKENHGGVDVCINNAGFSVPCPLLEGSTEHWRSLLDINVLALCICTKEAFKSMQERNVDDGHIININSLGGKRVRPNPDGHFYAATKFAVSALSEGVRNELREKGTHIRISQISPGFVETEFHQRSKGEEHAKKVHGAIKCLQSADIAEAVEYVLAAPPHVQVHDVWMRPVEQKS